MKKLLLTAALFLVASTTSVYASGGKITYKFATNLPAQHVITKGYMAIAEDVKTKSDGRLIINVYPSEQLGKERDVTDGISANVGDMSAIGVGEMSRRFRPALIFDAPYVFKGPQHLLAFANGPAGKNFGMSRPKRPTSGTWASSITAPAMSPPPKLRP